MAKPYRKACQEGGFKCHFYDDQQCLSLVYVRTGHRPEPTNDPATGHTSNYSIPNINK